MHSELALESTRTEQVGEVTPVFVDVQGRRQLLVQVISATLAALLAGLAVMVFVSIVGSARVPTPPWPAESLTSRTAVPFP